MSIVVYILFYSSLFIAHNLAFMLYVLPNLLNPKIIFL